MIKNAFDFSGKNVLIAGGTSGINLGIAQAFAEAGARVAVLSRSQEKVDAAVKKLSSLGPKAIGFVADVRDYEAIESTFSQAQQSLGSFDVLVSGAAGNFPAPALGMSSKGFRAVVDIDLVGTFHVLRAAFPFLTKPGASIINISAPQSYQAMDLQMHVCAAKAGVDMVTRVAALEWGAAGVRVNSISPGPIDKTEGMQRLAPTEEIKDMVAKSVPLGRFGTTQDIASACLWLSSPMASYITGTVIRVDGGWSLTGAAVSSATMKKMFLGES